MNQEIFDKTVRHFAAQVEPSATYSDTGAMQHCLYRHPEGLMCAAGIHITDEEYTSDMEGKPLTRIVPSRLECYSPILDKLQMIHDGEAYAKRKLNSPEAADKLKDLAKDYRLKTDILEIFAGK